jgi:endonuclease/exonuclease/phosphatase family metal-dependent hydrolase
VHPGKAGLTWSTERGEARTRRSNDVDRRLDYIFVTPRQKDGRGTITDARIVVDERDGDGRCASDHFGLLADVQIAPNSAT